MGSKAGILKKVLNLVLMCSITNTAHAKAPPATHTDRRAVRVSAHAWIVMFTCCHARYALASSMAPRRVRRFANTYRSKAKGSL